MGVGLYQPLNYGVADMTMVGQIIPLLQPTSSPLPQPIQIPPPYSSNMVHNYHLWQQQQQQQQQNQPSPNPNPNLNLRAATTTIMNFNNFSSFEATTTCQDCGNQAKKDCAHRRCRSCCKSRRFECPTHVKSTWVPAARRRERQQLQLSGTNSAFTTSGSKKQRLVLPSTPNCANSHTSTSPRSFDTTSSRRRHHHHHHQEMGFQESLPMHIEAPAVFKCVRVTSIHDGVDEYAYQAVVNIGGHVFKGFLYDHGSEEKEENNGDGDGDEENNSDVPSMSKLHIAGSGSGSPSSSAMLVGVHREVYCSGREGGVGGVDGVNVTMGGGTTFAQ